jgi:hypothetical protein
MRSLGRQQSRLSKHGQSIARLTADPEVLTMTEAFPDPLSGWKTRFLGLHTNMENHYVMVNQCFYPSNVVDEDCRGNNWDGLWVSDRDVNDGNVYIRFDAEFAATLTSLALDIGSHLSDAVLKIYDKDMNVLLTETIPLGCSNCSMNNPGANIYSRHGIASTNGIGGFDIVDPSSPVNVEGNVGIDNVTVTQGEEGETTRRIDSDDPNTNTVAVEEDANGDGNSSPVAGITIPPGTFNEDVDVTVRVVEVTPDVPCHDFLIAQIGKCVEITATNVDGGAPATLNNNVTVGVCLPEDLHIEMYKFDSPTGRAIPLRQVPFDVVCDDAEFASAKPGNWLEGLAMGLSRKVGRLISPKLAYAADRGFGGEVEKDGGLSTFTWAAPIQLSRAAIAINLFHSGKDAFGVSGAFSLAPKDDDPHKDEHGFDPAAHDVTVAFGSLVESIPRTSWRFVQRTNRWTYVSAASVGVNYLDINPETGDFRLAGRTLSKDDALPAGRAFTLQVGHRIRGHFLLCSAPGICTAQH